MLIDIVSSFLPLQPSSATVDSGPTMRKLFHAVDDELIRVPNAVSHHNNNDVESLTKCTPKKWTLSMSCVGYEDTPKICPLRKFLILGGVSNLESL